MNISFGKARVYPMRENIAPETAAALARCRTMIATGSKSFSLAARLFPPAIRDAAFLLYGWCRYCDDETDERRADSPAARLKRVSALITATRSALAGEPQKNDVFDALGHVAGRYSIPEHYPLELLEGMAMDARGQRYETLDELLLYCYRVAGTVGLMMAHVMGVSDERALKNAAHLGIAMQLTNIARDVVADAADGRIYLPLSWLAEAEILAPEIARPAYRPLIAGVIGRLLAEAARYYRSGDVGVRFLDFHCAFAVAAARHVYSDIGALIERRGAAAWDDRVFTTRRRKLRAVARGFAQALRYSDARLRKPAAIKTLWRFSDVKEISSEVKQCSRFPGLFSASNSRS